MSQGIQVQQKNIVGGHHRFGIDNRCEPEEEHEDDADDLGDVLEEDIGGGDEES